MYFSFLFHKGLERQPQVTAVDIGMLASMLMVDFGDVRSMIGDNFGDFLELAGLIDEFEAEVGNPPCRQERARDDARKDGDES